MRWAIGSPSMTADTALVYGDVSGPGPVLTRVHSECLTGDVFGSQRCDCGPQLHEALDLIVQEGRGVVVYLRGHEGRGIGLLANCRPIRSKTKAVTLLMPISTWACRQTPDTMELPPRS
ncbi:MAG: hypothetical protein R2709_03810 [Marmoricola sp.]